jgi:hypothetical protein
MGPVEEVLAVAGAIMLLLGVTGGIKGIATKWFKTGEFVPLGDRIAATLLGGALIGLAAVFAADVKGTGLWITLTVAQLGGLAKPSVPINNHTLYVPRQPGPEKKTYRVNAVLVKMRKETDGDIHLVIADPGPNGKRMVAEFPNASCPPASTSPRRPDMEAARKALTDHCGPAPYSFKKGMLEGTATVKGVGFFDFKHAGDQADNGIELHPVAKLTNVVCKRVSS